MAPDKAAAFRLPEELLEGLRQVRVRDGVPVSEQVRRAIITWLDSKGVTPEKPSAAPRRAKKRSVKPKPKV